jgi:6-phosphofructokinase 1
MLARDIEFLRENFKKDTGASRAGKIILRNEQASKVYTTQVIADMIEQEAHGRFECKSANPGHFQQGGKPSPMDRVRALRMAIKCMQHIEGFAGMSRDDIMKDELSAVVIGIQGAQVVFTAMGGDKGLENTDTDWKSRRPKREFWLKMKDTVDVLSGRPKATDCCEECGRLFGSNTPMRKLTPSVSVTPLHPLTPSVSVTPMPPFTHSVSVNIIPPQ